jgi:hypothetical protein
MVHVKKILLLFIIVGLFSIFTYSQKIKIRSQITPNCGITSNLKFADIYADGNIAVMGSYNCRGAFIFDISNPDAPTLASWYNPGANQQFLEAIVVGNRGYFGSGNGGGVHIVDLTNPTNPVLLGTVNSTNGNAHNSIHEMVVFNQGNQTYLIENYNSLSFTKTLKVINVTNPASPVFVRDIVPTEPQWVHAMHLRGNRMFTSGWGNSTSRGRTEIYDISNIATQAPTLLGFIEDTTSITAGNSMHSSWSSEDGNYLYSCRETSSGNGDVRVYNITNPAVPVLVKRIGMVELGLNAVTPHNPVVAGNYLYVAWYQAGLQVFDISNPANPVRVGQYDTFQPVFVGKEITKTSLADEPWDLVCGTTATQNALPTSYDGNWAVFPFLGTDKVLTGDLAYGLQVVDISKVNQLPRNQNSDFNGDGKTDISTFSPSTGLWNVDCSGTGCNATQWGLSTDKIVTGDYDGDGKADRAVWRGTTGTWFIYYSSTSTYTAYQFGQNGDIPMPADFDSDFKTDYAIYRPSTGIWYIQQSLLGFKAFPWGNSTDKPLVGDFEGDGKADVAVYRPSEGNWYVLQSSSSLMLAINFGLSTDKPMSADFDGDFKTDFAVYRPSTGFWYILNSRDYSLTSLPFGISEDIPSPADYDGDGKADITVFRPSANAWYRLNSTNGAFFAKTFGQTGDVPLPSIVNP